jgi:DUF1680 family protein
VGFQRIHVLTGEPRYSSAAQFFWKTVVTTRSFATGGNADNEHFFPVDEFDRHIPSAKTMETCCSHNMLRLTRMLFMTDPSAGYADYYERALYNTILASQDPDTGMVTYFQSTRPGYLKLYCTPVDSFWCCTGRASRTTPSTATRSISTGPRTVRIACTSTCSSPPPELEGKGAGADPDHEVPRDGSEPPGGDDGEPGDITLKIRHPGWCSTATVKVNGKVAATSPNPGGYIALKRTWKAGDVVEVDVPMALRMEPLHASTTHAAVVYGPIVLAGALGHRVAPGADLHVNERTIGEPFNDPIEVPVLVGDLAKMAARIKARMLRSHSEPMDWAARRTSRLSRTTASPTNTTTSTGGSSARRFASRERATRQRAARSPLTAATPSGWSSRCFDIPRWP